MNTLSKVIFISCTVIGMAACTKQHVSYVPTYKEKISEDKGVADLGSTVTEEWIQGKISSVMQNLKSPDVDERIRNLYAKDLYFNDTLHTFTDVDTLTDYLKLTGNRLLMIEIDIDDVAIKNFDAYVRWTMRYQLNENKPQIESIGMTHFRFNQQGKVVLHQDYWDNVEGFYRTVPVLGSLVSTVRKATGD